MGKMTMSTPRAQQKCLYFRQGELGRNVRNASFIFPG